ncbi:unnamed protein product [Arctia plantaginis]|uniref:DUF4219 domain-containing protein n=1 Tax=Arctia plantaginis TaxID=874455 RepID=A0A8S1AQP9_ARCPL|nr:unnamed protein product [Arctia plantaginis]CAB3250575.1 unnamed protein product [Arctia plantaginis]
MVSSSGSSGQNLLTFEKLKGATNYEDWKFQMELYLIHEDLWKYTMVTPEDDEMEIKQDQLARAKIGLMVEKDCLGYLRHTKNTRQAWEALRKVFENDEGNNSSKLLKKLLRLRLDQFKSIKEYVAEVMSASQKLKAMGKEVNDELLATILLQGLTKEYIPIRVAIETSNTTLTADYVKTKLLSIEEELSTVSDDEDFSVVTMPKKRVSVPKSKCNLKSENCSSKLKTRDCLDVTFGESVTLYCDRDGESTTPRRKHRGTFQGTNRTNLFADSGDYAHVRERGNYPCFMIWAQILLWGLAKVFQFW